MALPPADMTDETIRTLASDEWHRDGEIEIDSDAVVSRSEDGGAYVAAWVWVYTNPGDDEE